MTSTTEVVRISRKQNQINHNRAVLEWSIKTLLDGFNSISRYLDDLLNIDNPYFEGMVKQISP